MDYTKSGLAPLVLGLAALLLSCGTEGARSNAQDSVTIVRAILTSGHSNNGGHNVDANGSNNPPFGVPTSQVDLLRRGLVANETVSDAVFKQLQVSVYGGAAGTSHASELALGINLIQNLPPNNKIAILKVSANSSKITDWSSAGPGAYNASLQTAISDFKTLIAAKYPGAIVKWYWIVMLGTNESGPAQPNNSLAAAMPTNFAVLKSDVDSYIGETMAPFIVRESSNMTVLTWLSTERASQATMASNSGGTLIDTDSILVGGLQSDGVHYTGAGHNALGSLGLGPAILARIAAE